MYLNKFVLGMKKVVYWNKVVLRINMVMYWNKVVLGINMAMQWNTPVAGKHVKQIQHPTVFITHNKNMQFVSHNSSLQLHNSLHCSFCHTAQILIEHVGEK